MLHLKIRLNKRYLKDLLFIKNEKYYYTSIASYKSLNKTTKTKNAYPQGYGPHERQSFIILELKFESLNCNIDLIEKRTKSVPVFLQ